MQRLSLRLGARAYGPRASLCGPYRLSNLRATYATSAPKSAEKASAASGGSRSKDAAEQHQKEDGSAPETETGSGPASGTVVDGLASGDARGATGGGEPLGASKNPPPQPKILNASVTDRNQLTEEQKREVDEHNRDFEKKHDRASPASADKVNKSFWSGTGERENNK